MAEIRAPEEKDRQSIIDLMRISFNAQAALMRQVAPEMKLHRFLAAYEEGRMVAMALSWDLTQSFGGRAVPMSGIAAVAAWPEERERGLAPECVKQLLVRAREKGQVISTLYPSRAAVYRRLGYEYAGILAQHRFPIAEIPGAAETRRSAPPSSEGGPTQVSRGTSPDGDGTNLSDVGAPGRVTELLDAEMDELRACYRRFAAKQNGLVDCADEDWWRMRVIRRWNQDVNARAVVFRRDGRIEGYATFQIESQPETWRFRIVCTHFIAETAAAYRGLLAYFRGFRGLGQFLVWYGPPADPINLVGGGGAETLQAARTVRWMTRILDVKGALEARGYPAVEGSVVIRVKDDLFAANSATFRIAAKQGKVSVERAAQDVSAASAPRDASPANATRDTSRTNTGRDASAANAALGAAVPLELTIGALSTLYTGYASPHELARAGLIEGGDSQALAFFGNLFGGPFPRSTDFF